MCVVYCLHCDVFLIYIINEKNKNIRDGNIIKKKKMAKLLIKIWKSMNINIWINVYKLILV